MNLLNKLRLYDGQTVRHFTADDVEEMRRHSPTEGMTGISPRYVMNRLSAVASLPEVHCVSPLSALNSLWQGLRENVSMGDADLVKYIGFIKDTVAEYNDRAVREVQRAFKEGFEQSAADLLSDYLANLATHLNGGDANERDMRDIEKHVGITDRVRVGFREEIHQHFTSLRERGFPFDYTTEPRIRSAIETHLFPGRRVIQRTLSQPRFAKQRAEWRRERGAVVNRLISSYGYCWECANFLIDYVVLILRGGSVFKSPRNEGVEWQLDLNPAPPPPPEEAG
jgi:serine protein kinase